MKAKYYISGDEKEKMEETLAQAKKIWGKMIYLEEVPKKEIGNLLINVIGIFERLRIDE